MVAEEGGTLPKPVTFISFDFTRTDLIEQLRRKIKAAKLRPADGQELSGKDGLREEIIERIKGCDGFLGVWTLDSKTKRFSPWLLWELAVAQSFSIPFQLIIAADFPKEIYRLILSERYLRIFKEGEFSAKSLGAIKALATEIEQVMSRKREVLLANTKF